jgi:hypothetical protein
LERKNRVRKFQSEKNSSEKKLQSDKKLAKSDIYQKTIAVSQKFINESQDEANCVKNRWIVV